jgi:hypothetical protein
VLKGAGGGGLQLGVGEEDLLEGLGGPGVQFVAGFLARRFFFNAAVTQARELRASGAFVALASQA